MLPSIGYEGSLNRLMRMTFVLDITLHHLLEELCSSLQSSSDPHFQMRICK